MQSLGIIAGKGIYPQLLLEGARVAGVGRIVIAAFEGETSPELVKQADVAEWMRVGQLGRMISFFKQQNIEQVIMAGQITPKNLFDLRPDLKAILLLARVKRRNAETLFGAIGDELEKNEIKLLPATHYMEQHLAPAGHIAGPKAGRSVLRDISFGWPLVKQISALDIGQTMVVKQGTVLAVEGFDGTNSTIQRGGELGHGGAVVLKVSKPNQDFRFDVPVIGPDTICVATAAKVSTIVCEAKKTLLLGLKELRDLADAQGVTVLGYEDVQS